MLAIWPCGMKKGLIKMEQYPFEREEWCKVFEVAGMVQFGITDGEICLREKKKYFSPYKRKGNEDE